MPKSKGSSALKSSTNIVVGGKKCTPFMLGVMVYSPEAGYKFSIEVQKACTDAGDAVWKLLFDLYKRNASNNFDEIISVVFVAGDPNEIKSVAAITSEGMKRPQVQAFRDNVYPLVKPFGDSGQQPNAQQQQQIHTTIASALLAK